MLNLTSSPRKASLFPRKYALAPNKRSVFLSVIRVCRPTRAGGGTTKDRYPRERLAKSVSGGPKSTRHLTWKPVVGKDLHVRSLLASASTHSGPAPIEPRALSASIQRRALPISIRGVPMTCRCTPSPSTLAVFGSTERTHATSWLLQPLEFQTHRQFVLLWTFDGSAASHCRDVRRDVRTDSFYFFYGGNCWCCRLMIFMIL